MKIPCSLPVSPNNDEYIKITEDLCIQFSVPFLILLNLQSSLSRKHGNRFNRLQTAMPVERKELSEKKTSMLLEWTLCLD